MSIQNDPNATYKLLAREFTKRGYTFEKEVNDGRAFAVYTSPRDRVWRTHAARISYPFTKEEMRLLAMHKEVAYNFVKKLGVSVPFTHHLGPDDSIDESYTNALLEKYGSLIVKPSDSSLSRGLTLNIRSFTELLEAIKVAREISPSILIQEQVHGEEVRFTLLEGKIVAALLRQTPRVIGDGVSTVAELIEIENRKRKTITESYVPYPLLTEKLIDEAYFSDERVLGDQEVLELSKATMIREGCSVYDIIDTIHPSYIDKIENLGASSSTKFIVIDVFIEDYKRPLSEDNYWFIEFNTSPVLSLFYSCRDGRPCDIIPKLVSSIDRYIHGESDEGRILVGSFEPVSFSGMDGKLVTAKVDTGAYSGAVYAENIQRKTDQNGRVYIEFELLGDKNNKQVSYDYYLRSVRSAHGHVLKRYVVKLDMEVKGKTYPTEIGLSNRSDMKFHVLIGRRFLREHNMIVDVIVNEEMDYEKERLG